MGKLGLQNGIASTRIKHDDDQTTELEPTWRRSIDEFKY